MSRQPHDFEPVLQADGLGRDYSIGGGLFRPRRLVRALAEVSLQVAPGETLAVVGESGSGKSTLARLLTLVEAPSRGSLSIDGQPAPVPPLPTGHPLRRAVQMVFQNPYGSLNPRQTVGAILEEPLIVNGLGAGRAERQERVAAILAAVGLRPDQLGRYPHMFSGGQRQRIAIARALVLEPRIIVLDEPVAALDVSIRAQILNLLADLQAERQVAYVFISHDLSVVRHIAGVLLVMYLGRAVEQGPAQRLFAEPRHPYTRALISATPVADPGLRRDRILLSGEPPSPLRPPEGCVFHPRCPFRIPRCEKEAPELRPVSGRAVRCHRAEEVPELTVPASHRTAA